MCARGGLPATQLSVHMGRTSRERSTPKSKVECGAQIGNDAIGCVAIFATNGTGIRMTNICGDTVIMDARNRYD